MNKKIIIFTVILSTILTSILGVCTYWFETGLPAIHNNSVVSDCQDSASASCTYENSDHMVQLLDYAPVTLVSSLVDLAVAMALFVFFFISRKDKTLKKDNLGLDFLIIRQRFRFAPQIISSPFLARLFSQGILNSKIYA